MAVSERLIDAGVGVIAAFKKKEDYDRERRVERAIDNQGRPVIEPRDFIAMRSPDGSVWRYRIDNSGNWLPGVKEA